MDGIAKGKLQEEIGVREIVEDVDALRLSLGFDRVKVLTPKVETRLRSASLANIPLKLVGEINPTCLVELTFPHGYPRTPIEARILTAASEETATINAEMTELLQQFCSQPITATSDNVMDHDHADDQEEEEETFYPRALAAVTFVHTLVSANEQPSSIPHTSAASSSYATISGCESRTTTEENVVDTDDACEVDAQPTPIINYTCMICGTFLFNTTHIESHPSPRAKDLERHHKSGGGGGGGGGKGQSSSCASIFLSAETSGTFLDNIKLVENQGKFACPKCHGKIGQWCWTGNLISHAVALVYNHPRTSTLSCPFSCFLQHKWVAGPCSYVVHP